MPTMTAAVMPCFVVRFQNSSITSAGKFADAATLNAQPTRKLTFIFSNRMPKHDRDQADDDGRDLADADFLVIGQIGTRQNAARAGRAPPRRWRRRSARSPCPAPS